jgi:hypothetical protein
LLGISLDSDERIFVAFVARHVEQLGGVAQPRMNRGERFNDRLEGFFFFTEILRALGIFPNLGVFEFGVNLFEFL